MRESLDFKFSSRWVKLHREIKWLTLKKKSFGTIFKFKLPKNSTLCHYEIMLSGIQTDSFWHFPTVILVYSYRD